MIIYLQNVQSKYFLNWKGFSESYRIEYSVEPEAHTSSEGLSANKMVARAPFMVLEPAWYVLLVSGNITDAFV